MKSGGVGRGDPQFGLVSPVTPIKNVSVLKDGERFEAGGIEITAHLTPGHTPGGTSWTWESCEHEVCHDLVFADSLTPVSAAGFRFTDSREYPQALADFEKSFAFLETTKCDVLITTHPDMSEFWERVAARTAGAASDPMMNPAACRDYALHGRERLRQRLAEERSKETRKSK
jgi:metallo-beta-lactamase class B